MKLLININTGNAAFADNEGELKRIAEEALSKGLLLAEGDSDALFDLNGNRVGQVTRQAEASGQ